MQRSHKKVAELETVQRAFGVTEGFIEEADGHGVLGGAFAGARAARVIPSLDALRGAVGRLADERIEALETALSTKDEKLHELKALAVSSYANDSAIMAEVQRLHDELALASPKHRPTAHGARTGARTGGRSHVRWEGSQLSCRAGGARGVVVAIALGFVNFLDTTSALFALHARHADVGLAARAATARPRGHAAVASSWSPPSVFVNLIGTLDALFALHARHADVAPSRSRTAMLQSA
jgi:hypothetical protein